MLVLNMTESMATQGWEGQKGLPGGEKTRTCLEERAGILMKRVGEGLSAGGDSISKCRKFWEGIKGTLE
jgi:hypothetical protein